MEGRTRPRKSTELKRKRSKKEIDASQKQMPEISKSKHRHSHSLLKKAKKKTVKRHPFLSDVQYAELALAYCEKEDEEDDFSINIFSDEEGEENNVKFEVVQVLGAFRALLRPPGIGKFGVVDFCHVSFIAKPRNADGSDASPVFFFVELGDWGDGVLELMHSEKSQPGDSRITYGCGFCPSDGEKFPHLSGYIGGTDSVPLDAASQREMDRCFKRQLINSRFQVEPERDEEPVPIYSAPELSDHGYAEIALKHINGRGNAKYEIVRTYEACVELLCFPGVEKVGEWCHISFIAKPRNADSDYTKFIFAEMVNYGEAEFSVNAYSILDPGGPDIKWNGCGFCPPNNGAHPHPADDGEYTAGRWPYSECGCSID